MATLTFTIENTNQDQVLTVMDLKNSSNIIFQGPVNHGDTTVLISCWKGSDDRGRIEISGSSSQTQQYDIRTDGEQIRY